jgi:DNA-directed RNA polymerase
MTPKEPFQFTASCIEYVAANRHGPTYETRFPCWRDAFSNGLQHMACLAQDEQLAALVGLESRYPENPLRPDIPDKIEEVREVVARAVKTRLRADKNHPASRFWFEHEDVLGTVLKQPVMTLPYGVTRPGMKDQIADAAEELELRPSKDAVKVLRDHVWQVIGEVMPGAVALRDWLQDRVKQEFARGGSVSWLTPTGVPVSNHYRKDKVVRVMLPFLGENVRIGNGYSAELDGNKMENGIIANYVHSIESSHLARSVNAAVNEGIVDVATVHDCFASLAPHVLRFARIRRRELSLLYHRNPLGQLVWRYVRSASDLPRRGKLTPLALQFSEHFDR